MKSICHFRKLDFKWVRDIILSWTQTSQYAGTTIIRNGEINDNVYFIEKGSVYVYVINEQSGK